MSRPRVFLDFSINNESAGRVIFELFNESAPKTSENFRALCTGERGLSPATGNPLYYKNSIIHRSIKDFMIQGGDFTKRNGTGGESIYGGTFPDEDLTRPLDSEGLLCMANRGPNTNGSQFFITLRECPHLNGKHTVFGKILRGEDVVRKIEDVAVDEKDRPTVPVMIYNCGELELRKKPQEPVKLHSDSESDSDRRQRRRRRSRSRSTSRSVGSDRARHKKKKKSKPKKPSDDEGEKDDKPVRILRPGQTVPETEAEYDARLEREELERIATERRREADRAKEIEQTKDGIRFKGRGRRKFVDPEIMRR